MSDYINGVSYPIFHIYTIGATSREGGEYVETIELPLCMEGGLVEEYAEDFKRIELENGYKVDYDNRAANIIFSLDYSTYVKKDDLFKIDRLCYYNSRPEDFKIILVPRADALGRYFEVRFLDAAFSLGVHKGGSNAIGNRLPVIKFVTVYPVGKFFVDPDTLSAPLPHNLKIA